MIKRIAAGAIAAAVMAMTLNMCIVGAAGAAPEVENEPVEIVEPSEIKQVLIPIRQVVEIDEVRTEQTEEPPEPEYPFGLTESDIDLMANVVAAEAVSEGLYGMQLVADTIINRLEDGDFPNNFKDVLKGYQVMYDGGIGRIPATEESYLACRMELKERVDKTIFYFQAGQYSKYGTPKYQYGRHWFSGK